jgi:hypothetical protein
MQMGTYDIPTAANLLQTCLAKLHTNLKNMFEVFEFLSEYTRTSEVQLTDM